MENTLKKKCKKQVTRLLCLAAFFFGVHAGAFAQSEKITLDVRDVPIRQFFNKIEAQSEYRFTYRDKSIDNERHITYSTSGETIESLLQKALTPLGLQFQISGKNILIMRNALAQNEQQGGNKKKIFTGTITDAKREPVIGANIAVKETSTGTITDLDGKFSIEAPVGSTLSISYIGYMTQEIRLNENTNLKITIQEDQLQLSEVVVVGYGTKVKGALTGSIVKADSKVFETRPVDNAVNVLQGTMPGVSVIRGTTRPGYDQTEVQIRGYSSMAGVRPLILIDGIAGNLFMLNPKDIENVTVLKDASASIYGARASDGVILVTTKKGKAGKPQLSYSGNFGIKTPHYLKEMTTTSQLIDMYNESKTNLGLPLASQEVVDKIKSGIAEPDPNGGWIAGLEPFPGFYGYYDWNEMTIGSSTLQNHDISISGGSENGTYLVSAGYNRDEGFFKYGDQSVSNRYNMAANGNFKNIFNRIDIDTRIQFDSRRTNEPTAADAVLENLPKLWRFIPPYNPDGNFYQWQNYGNPANMLTNGGRKTISNDRLTLNTKADLRILEGLKLTGQYGVSIAYNDTKTENRMYRGYNWANGVQGTLNNPNSVSFAPSHNRYSSYTAYLEYIKVFAGKHNFSLMTGTAHEENDAESKSLTGRNLLSNDIFEMNLSDKTDIKYLIANTYASDWALTSLFGRMSYNFNMRYLVDFTLRADGSSKFASDKRWSALFPAVATAWNISKERFMSSQNLLDNLKLRLSWGQSGNQELSFGNYDYIPLVSLNNSIYPFGQPGVNATGATSSIASRERSWETITTYNAGLDFGLLNSRLSGSFEVYLKRNSNMLVAQELPALLGGAAPTQNIGELETKGFDLSLSWKDRIRDFSYGITFLLSDSQNKLLSLKGSDAKGEGLYRVREGYSMYSFFGYKSDGIIRTQEQLDEYKKLGGTVPARIGIGDMMYHDMDGDGKITTFGDDGQSGDLICIGNLLPRYMYSSNIELSYKNIDLSVFIQGVGKRNVVRTGDFQAPFQQWWYQPLAYYYGKTWTPDSPDATVPRIIEGGRGWDDVRNWNYRYSDSPHRLIDVSYLRVKLITLAYRIPQSICDKMKIQGIRIYASGQDLITFANGTWGGSFDPEEGWQRNDLYTYPFSNIVSFGLDVKF